MGARITALAWSCRASVQRGAGLGHGGPGAGEVGAQDVALGADHADWLRLTSRSARARSAADWAATAVAALLDVLAGDDAGIAQGVEALAVLLGAQVLRVGGVDGGARRDDLRAGQGFVGAER
jgi:hypothetical protein